MSTRVLLAGDQPVVLDAVGYALSRAPALEVISLLPDRDTVIERAQELQPNVSVLVVGSLRYDGVGLASLLRRHLPSCGVVMILLIVSRSLVEQAFLSGVRGLMSKDARLPQLVGAIQSVAAGCLSVDPSFLPSAASSPVQALNRRDQEILRLTATGASVKEVAAELCISGGTVRNATSCLIKKLNARNRFDAALIADDRGLL